MKHRKKMQESFGEELPKRFGSTKAARVVAANFDCAPHDEDCTGNGKYEKDLRCWKRYRRTQYRQAA